MNQPAKYMFMMEYINSILKNNIKINNDTIAKDFDLHLRTLSTDIFIEKFIYTGYIPDIYASDSSEETLFAKLVEVMTAEWARRMGFHSQYIKQKSSYQDVDIVISDRVVVCDAKSFRLGRSQMAPNVKDFLKLADIAKWLDRYSEAKRLGGLIVYPCKHEWAKGSDVYQYCSTKATPTLMLPYKYLAFLLKYSTQYDTKNLVQLWDHARIFPVALKNKATNKKDYWDIINQEIIRITKTTPEVLSIFMSSADQSINNCIKANIAYLQKVLENIKIQKRRQLNQLDKRQLEDRLLNIMIEKDSKNIGQSLININKFRL